jgi:hypothetical protein
VSLLEVPQPGLGTRALRVVEAGLHRSLLQLAAT